MSFSQKLLKKLLPETHPFVRPSQTLFETLSRSPQDGVGVLVRQKRWDRLNRMNTYWEVTRVKLKNEGKHGKVWGKFVYKGAYLIVFLIFA